MYFERVEDALVFYVRYVQLAGFNIRRNRSRNNGSVQEVECSASEQYKGGLSPDRTPGKTTKKKKCKAMMCITRSTTLPER
jgi:hypothetical protein